MIIATLQLSLEKKVLLVSRYKSLLSSVISTLIGLLFPFMWMHVLIPVLPEEMCEFLECPFPFLIGLERRFYEKTKSLISEDVIIINLDRGVTKTSEVLPKMPAKEYRSLTARVRKASQNFCLHSTGKEREKELKSCEDAFDFNTYGLLNDAVEVRFDAFEIRDAFLSFF